MKNYKISIIIPIYNAEDYLKNTIHSIISQTFGFENIELILIDDCSTDNSKKIIKHFENKYKNIFAIYLNKNHGSAGTPRNYGIKSASAEYIMFIDADDEYDAEICENFYKIITSEKSDLVGCGYNEVDITMNIKLESRNNLNLIKSAEIKKYGKYTFISSDLMKHFIYYDKMMWCKMYKKNIILNNNIQFQNRIGEDHLFVTEYILCCSKISFFTNYCGYNHIIHGSNVSILSISETLNYIKLNYDILNLFKKKSFYPNLEFYFRGTINYTIIKAFQLSEAKLSDIHTIVTELYAFEKTIRIKKIKLNNYIISFINKLILKKRFKISSIIIYLFARLYKFDFLLKIYLKLFRK